MWSFSCVHLEWVTLKFVSKIENGRGSVIKNFIIWVVTCDDGMVFKEQSKCEFTTYGS